MAAITNSAGLLRVLVVDDMSDNGFSLGLLLRFFGYETEVAYSGTQALQFVEAFRPDVVLLDLAMPGMDGFEVALRLHSKDQRPQPTLIALTAFSDPEIKDRLDASGFHGHLVKPVDPELLDRILGGLMPRRDGMKNARMVGPVRNAPN